ncbi:MAG: hypothetical protein IPJ26_07640 [Bacteroidetes bacterium]|nr:hypothetical protein [Bacteroidota bacterium]
MHNNGYGMSTTGENDNFEHYIEKFKPIELPFLISRSVLDSTLPDQLTALDSSDVVNFIQANKSFGDDITLLDIYKFYPYAQFTFNDNLKGVFVLQSGGAGGVEMVFSLIIYNRSGEQTDKFDFAKEIGDCSRLQVKTGEISLDLNIVTKSTLLVSDCETDDYKEKSSQIERFKITSSGKVEKL